MSELTDINISDFPKPGKILREKTVSDFLDELADLHNRMDYFLYTDTQETNDVREGYMQFMDDADKYMEVFREIILDITEAMRYYSNIKEHTAALVRAARKYKNQVEKFNTGMLDSGIDPLDPLGTVAEVEKEVTDKAQELMRRKEKLDEVEQEIEITADKLAKKKSEMELALRSRYTLTERQRAALLDEKDRILDGIEKWGSVSGALSHDKSITSKTSTIMMYCSKFPEFGQAIAVSKQLFKDRLEGIMIERALEGTENPQFGKGEYIGDYKIKDNKLLLELMKAKVPEEYNKKSVETTKNQQVNNMNIISFANIDETKKGFTRNVGVVIDVDDTGKVQRITQEKKMKEYYEKKEGAEIIEPCDNGVKSNE